MKALLLTAFGDENVFEYTESFPEPEIKPDEVLIKVKAVALNRLDVWIRKGVLAFKPPLPHILGSDVAGVVIKVGELVDNVKEGDEVVVNPNLSCGVCEACLSGRDNLCRDFKILGFQVKGGYAEYVKVPKTNVVPKPKNLTFEEAASFPLTYITAWNAVVDAGIKAGDVVFIWGASSGVGVAAVQLAKLFGAFVIGITSNEEKAEKLKSLGVDLVVNRKTQSVEEEIKKHFPEGVDLVVDYVGEKTFPISVRLLKKGGKLSFLGTTTGSRAEFNLREAFVKGLTFRGVYMGRKSTLFRIAELFERGRLKPVVDRVFPLGEGAEAHRYLESERHFGKVVLKVDV